MSALSGWYYDLFQDPGEEPDKFNINRLTTVSLHANSRYLSKDNWAYSEITCNRDQDLKKRGFDKKIGEDYDEDGYFYKPICTAVLQEDFQVTIQNMWSDMGDDKIGGFINSVRANVAPFAGTVSAGLDKMLKDQQKLSKEDKESFMGKALTGLVELAHYALVGEGKDNQNSGQGRAAKYLNSALLVNGSKFSIYQGSNLNFNNMGMRFTVIPKWDPETGIFVTVPQQLREMYRYFFGEFIGLDDVLLDAEKDKEEAKKEGREQNALFRNELASRITWQRPPGGYQADMSQLDAVQKGSLKLKIGGNYSICNVVVESAALTFSKQMVKNPRTTYERLHNVGNVSGTDYLTPLSCDVNLMLRPCTRYSDQTFKSIIEGAGMMQEREELADKVLNNLKEGMEDVVDSKKGYLLPGVDRKIYNPKEKYNPYFQANSLPLIPEDAQDLADMTVRDQANRLIEESKTNTLQQTLENLIFNKPQIAGKIMADPEVVNDIVNNPDKANELIDEIKADDSPYS